MSSPLDEIVFVIEHGRIIESPIREVPGFASRPGESDAMVYMDFLIDSYVDWFETREEAMAYLDEVT